MENQNYIKILQNYLGKENPVYTLVFDENNGPSHLFKYKVTAKDKTVIGEGKTKKQAKQDAARLLYELMTKKEEVTVEEPQKKQVEEAASENNEKGNNLIEDLYNICKSLYLRPPTFKSEISYSYGHSPSYIVSCEVSGLKVKMQAFNKRIAKYKAASWMIMKLKEIEKSFEAYVKHMKEEQKKLVEKEGLSTNTQSATKETLQKLFDAVGEAKISDLIKPSKLLNEIKFQDISKLNDPERVFRQILKEMEYEINTDCYFVPGYGWIYSVHVFGLRSNFLHGDKNKNVAKKNAFFEALKSLCTI